MGFLTRLLAGLVSAATLGAGLSGTANVVGTTTATAGTTGAVTATADDTGGRTVLDCRQSGEGATGPYADNFCWIDWSNLPLSRTGEPIPVRINVPGGHIDADATITHTDNAALAAKDFTGSKWSRLTSAYKLTGNTALAFSGRMGRQDPAASVTFSNITPSADRTDTGVNVLKDFRLAFGDAEVMSGGVLQGHDVYEQTDIESDKTLEKLGMIGSGDPNQSYSKANTGYGTTHVTLAGGPKGATDDANKDSKGSAVVGAKQASRFKVSFGQVNQHWDGWGSAIAVGVYMPYLTAYPLTYDKNSSDAAGEVPSNQRGKENTTQPAKTKTNGKIRLASDTSKLSDHLVNSDFEYLPDGGWKTINARYDMASAYTSVDPNNGQYIRNTRHADSDTGTAWVDWDGFDASKFAWRTDQKGGQDQGGLKDRANAVELQQDSTDGNTYAEMVASETGRTIYQDLKTIPGTLYKIRLKHASLCKDNVDKMQVVINGTPIEMTRVTANGKAGDKVGEKSTTIATKVTNENRWHHADQWETYEGYYVIPDGQITTRFGFKAVNYLDPTKGNLLDDVTFARAYKLSYDKNATDANGSVPSDTTEGATKQAKAKTTGTVKTVADENVRYGSLANGDFSYPSFSDIQKNEQEGYADLRTFLKSDDGTLWYNMSATDLSKYGKIGQIPGFDSSRFAWSSTENGSRVELQQDRNTKNTYAEIVAQQDNTSIYQNVSTGNGGVLYKIRLKHASRQSSHADRMQVLVGSDTDHATPVEMTRVISNGHGDKVGGKSTIITTKVSNTDPRDHGAQWETYEGYYQVPEGQKNTVFMFKSLEGFKEYETLSGNNIGNLVDDIEFSRSYKLTYDKNSDDATGSVPSDTTANTVKQAKAKSSGTVRLAADRTDGKVSDLVQRTTTHADGSVTVRTVDTTTDVVSGCQVYYPAGQKITLATMAKDDDCWDSSMLSRPGHTQLGWNQDRNATQAQAEVTMVEGGMAVYAVWVGNPVLTYDTNKPATWSGQMPSTPASVSVAYNTAVTDGSGWRAGDTTKIRGYRFLGWYTGPQDNAGLYDWNTLLTGSVTVYAHWQRLQANVIYDANGGTGSHANTTGWQYSDVTIPGDTSKSFTRDGYVFKGWSLKAGKADVVYKDGSQIPLQDKDITLYAQWQGIHENFTETGGISLPLLIAGGIGLLVMGVGSTVMLTRRMNGHGMPDGE
ncbi:InlB B-repeat-containing protein [Bifidobacterium adolescentis]|nr:InlB B-repeat-containing protein [Bifidobacterium adolescentis]MDB1407695.1 InlB B-repeat-containing protein [Bifidobacterium adolescentis]MDB1411137.1 InlB B-repeat-containing protein [Bifidobacterium adolescentis]